MKIHPALLAKSSLAYAGTFKRNTQRFLAVCCLSVFLLGCASMAQEESIVSLRSELEALKDDLSQQATARDDQLVSSVSSEMEDVNKSIRRLSSHVKKHCKQEVTKVCEVKTQTVVMQADKLIVGQVEHVWVDPPGVLLSARVDSGAQSSSLHANNIVEFERDGSDWVRFDLDHSGQEITIERAVEKYVRVLQQSDKEGTRRPVVEMRIFIGNVKESFAFTLADRSHLAHAMILGRNFLTDIALVDVAQEFVQPKYLPGESS